MAAHAPQPLNRRIVFLVVAFVGLFAATAAWSLLSLGHSQPAVAQTSDAEGPFATLTLEEGEVLIRLRPDLAPNHVERITTLANDGFYDGHLFHRVIENFMAQTGDPTGTGAGGSDLPDLEAEFSSEPFVRGTLGMARSTDPNSANSQFFIVTGDSSHLNEQYTLFGEVIEGMDLVDALASGPQQANGMVPDPDTMVSLRVSDSL
ncbi:peptidylprolyl isomerase [Pelagibacterium montanilacus]|uniref:peptidylprolyl isomerase n=1 Tax=Pelagibacterium montanilacus TaxID=2185280 RepID=UPI000F8E18FE|nr:peptidylprolyl isomerase [Pelagibacterium montanilacus]